MLSIEENRLFTEQNMGFPPSLELASRRLFEIRGKANSNGNSENMQKMKTEIETSQRNGENTSEFGKSVNYKQNNK